MAISLDSISFSCTRQPQALSRPGAAAWVGLWAYPEGESAQEWADAVAERCHPDRIVEDWFDYSRHHFNVGVADGHVIAWVEVRLREGEAGDDDALLNLEGEELLGVVQGLIFDDGL